ncbi:hypothetical protein HDK90DRAFT_495513 [Phyllosticta capitalensis]|uniref:Secreted protein n=1 Tax=Phyllosticta capitalensis TaxID=121624 RepID=A0ABR1YF68_9PEZI
MMGVHVCLPGPLLMMHPVTAATTTPPSSGSSRVRSPCRRRCGRNKGRKSGREKKSDAVSQTTTDQTTLPTPLPGQAAMATARTLPRHDHQIDAAQHTIGGPGGIYSTRGASGFCTQCPTSNCSL